MIEQFYPFIWVGVFGTIGVLVFRAWLRYRTEQIKLAAREKLDLSKPEAAIDNLVGFIQAAPALYAEAKAKLDEVKSRNQGKNIDLKAEEQQLKLLEYAAKYQRPAMIVAPILAPILKKFVGKTVRSL